MLVWSAKRTMTQHLLTNTQTDIQRTADWEADQFTSDFITGDPSETDELINNSEGAKFSMLF